MTDFDQASIRLMYTAGDKPMDYVVRLVGTMVHNGGRRWWFLCPLEHDAAKAPLGVGNLHLPPGADYFGSREVFDLTYRSSQESGKFAGLFAQVARNIGTEPAAIRRAMRSAQR